VSSRVGIREFCHDDEEEEDGSAEGFEGDEVEIKFNDVMLR